MGYFLTWKILLAQNIEEFCYNKVLDHVNYIIIHEMKFYLVYSKNHVRKSLNSFFCCIGWFLCGYIIYSWPSIYILEHINNLDEKYTWPFLHCEREPNQSLLLAKNKSLALFLEINILHYDLLTFKQSICLP